MAKSFLSSKVRRVLRQAVAHPSIVSRIPRVPGDLPLIGNAISFLFDGMHPDRTFSRLHEAFGGRYQVNVPGQGRLVVTSHADDIPPIARPATNAVTKRDDPPFPWSEVWSTHPERALTYTWMSDQAYVDGIGVFKQALGSAEHAIPRFGTHMMWNIDRLLGRISQLRNPVDRTIPKLKERLFAFLIDPSLQLTCGKDLQFTLRNVEELSPELQLFYEAVLRLGPNALEVAKDPLARKLRTPSYKLCERYWEALYGSAQRWYDELKAARELNAGQWPNAVQRDKSIFLDGFEDYFEKGLCDERRLVCNIVEFVIGTADPGSQLIENVLLHLALQPEAQERIRDEFVAIFGADEAIETLTLRDWQRLRLLRSFVAETCRFMPLFSIHMRRTVEDTTLSDGVVVPRGTKVIFNYASMCQSAANYPQPDTFMPERFVDMPEWPNHPVGQTGRCPLSPGKVSNVEAVVPFGVGDRACAGIGWAVPMIGMTIGCLVRRYKLSYEGPLDIPYHGSTPNHPVELLDRYFKFEPRS